MFVRVDEGLDHFGSGEISVEAVELVQPEIVAVEVSVRCVIRVPAQISKEELRNWGQAFDSSILIKIVDLNCHR